MTATQEDLYEIEVHYLDLIQDHRGDQLRPALTFQGLADCGRRGGRRRRLTSAARHRRSCTAWSRTAGPCRCRCLARWMAADATGKPWICADAMATVRQRLNQETPPHAADPSDRPATRPEADMADVALAVLAHPDDAEFLCAGTLLRLAHGTRLARSTSPR